MASELDHTSLAETVEAVDALTQDGTETSVSEVTDAVGHSSHFTLILLVASLGVTPLSAVPGFSTASGMIIALTAGQALAGKSTIWLPSFLRRRKLSNDALHKALTHLHGWAERLDHYTQQRMRLLAAGPARTAFYGVFLLCGLLMPVLEFIPFSASIVASAIAVFSIAMLTRDGLLAAFGLAFLGLTSAFFAIFI